MGNTGSIQVQEVGEFRRLNMSNLPEDIQIPESPENRGKTDSVFLYIFIGFMVFLLPCLCYTLYYSDIRRINLYDQCGNLCGFTNKHYDLWSCTGKDLISKPYLKFKNPNLYNKTLNQLLREPRECVSDCGPGFVSIFHRCLKSNSKKPVNLNAGLTEVFNKVAREMGQIWWRIVVAVIGSIIICMLMLLVFRYAVAVFVWGVFIILFSALAGATCALWVLWSSRNEESEKRAALIGAGIMTGITIAVALVFAIMFKKIKLVIMLLKETAKAIFSMPMLIPMSLLVSVIQSLIGILFLTTTLLFLTTGQLQQLKMNFLAYVPNGFMIATEFINLAATIWAFNLLIGIQYMIVAGAISKWFFTRNKEYLERPISTSVHVVFKYHLGTVAFGSLIITIIMLLRMLIKSLQSNKRIKLIADCLLSCIEDAIKFLSKNAYIITALHGEGFWKSGKRASKLIAQNIINIVAINSVGDFVLGMAQLLIILLTWAFAYLCFAKAEIESILFAYALVLVFSGIMAGAIFSIFETAVDSIFICFCEDMLMNDGISKPYAMSKGLMEFIEKSKAVIGEKEVQVQST
ncbi:choline transporter-like protein 1 [Aethina tumida]|uniref:choline transporter-like protein 1 n=1 Tax=Aethina tumida TaxID=116153 RepID=UPI00096B4D30|nr:choline transporter-like protein 1 [Aethina tumida]XP_019868007.1 choline transporter-like protein 1 [Aethina tumida]